MVFDDLIKPNKEEKLDVILEELRQLKNVNKITELDLEKRIVVMEGALSEIKDSFGSIKNLKDLAQFIKHVDEIKNKLREIEDLSLIEKLESVELKDEFEEMGNTNAVMKEKIDLLVEAVRNVDPNEGDMAKTLNTVKDLAVKLERFDKVLVDMRQAGITRESFESLRGRADRALDQQETIKQEFTILTHTIREQMDLMLKKIDRSSAAQNLDELKEHVLSQGKELDSLRDQYQRIGEILEKSMKGFSSGSIASDLASIKKMRSSIEELYGMVGHYEIKIAELEKLASKSSRNGTEEMKEELHTLIDNEFQNVLSNIT